MSVCKHHESMLGIDNNDNVCCLSCGCVVSSYVMTTQELQELWDE